MAQHALECSSEVLLERLLICERQTDTWPCFSCLDAPFTSTCLQAIYRGSSQLLIVWSHQTSLPSGVYTSFCSARRMRERLRLWRGLQDIIAPTLTLIAHFASFRIPSQPCWQMAKYIIHGTMLSNLCPSLVRKLALS